MSYTNSLAYLLTFSNHRKDSDYRLTSVSGGTANSYTNTPHTEGGA